MNLLGTIQRYTKLASKQKLKANQSFITGANKLFFWKLSYWKHLLLRHNIDVMHNQKNVFDNVFNTILNVKGKMKDDLKSRRDIEELCKRPELHMKPNDSKKPKHVTN